MFNHWESGAPLGRRSFAANRAAVAVLAIVLLGFSAMVVAWHTDATPDRDCPICQVANLPLVKPAAVVQLAPPAFVERHVTAAPALQELEAALTFFSPRGPPA
jgi:hypothetical protein